MSKFQSPFLQRLLIPAVTLAILGACSMSACSTAPTPTPNAISAQTPMPEPTNTPSPTFTPDPSITPSITPTATNTPTPTATATSTPTPTPTAEPISISGDPRSVTLSEPERTFRAGCGVVDTFDFPIDPPHAYAVNRGGSDFGVFRGRYDKFHAGEDWGGFSGSALGTPVHSIGHGFVTYAQPLGWGRDKGVIIVQHVMQDGSEILSFYGHMDEESFQVSAGECVTRGQHLADIGNPRTPPHLHFEMRTQAPYQTLSGYWPEDPRTQGWVWPSQTIWAERLRVGPGVSWARDFTDIGTRPLAQISAEQYLIFEDENLLILSLADGESRPLRIDLGEDVKIIAAGASQDTLFIADSAGVVTAFDTTQLESNVLATKWQIERTLSQPVALIPRENGQLIIANRVSITGYAPGGRELWRHNLSQERLYDWQEAEGDFYFTLTGGAGSFWRATEENIVEKIGDAGGKLAYTANQNKPSSLWVYNPDGVYQFQLAPDSPFWLARPLSGGILNRGDILPLPDGGVLIAHADREDRRLIWLDDLGLVTDQWSYDGVLQGDQRLLSEGWQLYLISYGGPESLRDIPVYKINLQQRSLQHILTAGSRTPLQADHWTVQLDDGRILINVGGGPMGLFDPVEALEIVKP